MHVQFEGLLRSLPSIKKALSVAALALTTALFPGRAATAQPVLVGLDAELGLKGSTSAEAVRDGILLAIKEINASGGVLGGRPLELLQRANNSTPARSTANLRELARQKDMVAVFCGRFSPTVLQSLPVIHELRLPLMDPWAAANTIVDNGYQPNFVFRLSMRDDWAVERLMHYLDSRKIKRIGLMMLNTSWGRSTEQSALKHSAVYSNMQIVDTQWINWDDNVDTINLKYGRLLNKGAEGVLLTANADEAAVLARAMLQRPPEQRVPVVSHWGVLGGDLPSMVGERFKEIDFAVVTTFIPENVPAQKKLQAAFRQLYPNQAWPAAAVGLAHAYDLTHLLALAVNKAGNTDRDAIRRALLDLSAYDGAVRRYDRPFAPNRQEALSRNDVFLASYTGPNFALE